MRRFKFFKGHFQDDSPEGGLLVLDDVFVDHIEAWQNFCGSLGIDYSPQAVRALIAQNYYCTTTHVEEPKVCNVKNT